MSASQNGSSVKRERSWSKADRAEVRQFLAAMAVFPFHKWAKANAERAKALLEKLK